MRRNVVFAAFLIQLAFLTVSAQTDNRDNAEAWVNLKRIRINYGTASLDGRDSWDMFNKARVGVVWRVGTDDATEISTAADLSVGGKRVMAGRYSLWVRKLSADKWALSFHPKTDIPGLPEPTEGFIADAPLELTRVSSFNDRLLIVLTPGRNDVMVSIYWGSSKLEGALGVID